MYPFSFMQSTLSLTSSQILLPLQHQALLFNNAMLCFFSSTSDRSCSLPCIIINNYFCPLVKLVLLFPYHVLKASHHVCIQVTPPALDSGPNFSSVSLCAPEPILTLNHDMRIISTVNFLNVSIYQVLSACCQYL